MRRPPGNAENAPPDLAPRAALGLSDRLALRPAEAAEALGISERKLRQLLPRLPHVRADGVVLIPVEPLRRWLAEEARSEQARADRIAREQLDALSVAPRSVRGG